LSPLPRAERNTQSVLSDIADIYNNNNTALKDITKLIFDIIELEVTLRYSLTLYKTLITL